MGGKFGTTGDPLPPSEVVPAQEQPSEYDPSLPLDLQIIRILGQHVDEVVEYSNN